MVLQKRVPPTARLGNPWSRYCWALRPEASSSIASIQCNDITKLKLLLLCFAQIISGHLGVVAQVGNAIRQGKTIPGLALERLHAGEFIASLRIPFRSG